MHLSEILTHLGEDREKYFNAVAPPIIQSSNFAFKTIADFRNAIASELDNHLYTRGNNPTVEILRKKVAALEGAEDALILASGAGANAIAVMANVKQGDHVVCVQNPYSWTKSLLVNILTRFGVMHTFVDGTDTQNIEAAIRPETTVLFLESQP
ncbi:MAG: PLP-dependent transferase [Saprospiraceae bacterium]